MLLIDTFDRGVALAPDAPCLVTDDESVVLSYREVAALSHRVAGALARDGVARGARVGVISPNDPMAFVCVLGALRHGATWVPLNARATAPDLGALLSLTGCEVLVYHPSLTGLATELLDDVASLRLAVCLEPGGRAQDPVLARWMAPEGTEVERLAHEPERVAILFGTGGTTGRSKAVPFTHTMLETMNLAFAGHMPEPDPPVMAMAAPMTHAAGPICFPVFAQGGKVVVHDGVVPERLLASIGRHRVTRLFLPPTAIYALLAVPDVRSYDVSSLRHFIYAAAPMAVDKLVEAMDVFGPVMTQTFGQAEAPMVCTVFGPREHAEALADPAKRGRLASAGRASLVADVAIMGESGELLGPGELGEVVVRGSLVMAGYHGDDEQTAATRRPGGWHGTSDVGRMDEDGYVYIVDRLRDMVITGGFNVWPSEVEQVIHTIDGVKDCAVIGLPDEKWGEAVTAVVEPKPGFEVDEDEVVARCRERLGPVKAPKAVIVRELPRSPNGKVLKRALRDEYWAGQARAV
ncbi:AMP-binding protein [Conexibacter sp. SYSU D00693]|uniref:AMP-binding protein n=1 Tax=Conexibacter sp. SYSU D00693 TaxID=2812560 RepID=UPI00196A2789|nr:AMP-binding protein [Conexibacter sp. SYSU D00693]